MASKEKKEKIVKKQPELNGMPPKTELEKQGDVVVELWEACWNKREKLENEKEKLLPLMKANNQAILHLKDSSGRKLCIEIKTGGEKLTIKKEKEEEI